jgi:hypothetical protein
LVACAFVLGGHVVSCGTTWAGNPGESAAMSADSTKFCKGGVGAGGTHEIHGGGVCVRV